MSSQRSVASVSTGRSPRRAASPTRNGTDGRDFAKSGSTGAPPGENSASRSAAAPASRSAPGPDVLVTAMQTAARTERRSHGRHPIDLLELDAGGPRQNDQLWGRKRAGRQRRASGIDARS